MPYNLPKQPLTTMCKPPRLASTRHPLSNTLIAYRRGRIPPYPSFILTYSPCSTFTRSRSSYRAHVPSGDQEEDVGSYG
jgi:hypothetical protein